MSGPELIIVGGNVGLASWALKSRGDFPSAAAVAQKNKIAWAGIRAATTAASSTAAGVYYKSGSRQACLFEESGAAVERHFFLLMDAK